MLIDVAALKGTDMLGDAYEITGQDLQQALQRQNVSVQPGDAVIIHAGWARLRDKDNARYMKSNAEALPMPDVRSAEVSSSRRARY